jgi:hypothetical protein
LTLLIAAAHCAFADEPERPISTVHQLRNVAAADVATALTEFAARKKLSVTVVPEVLANTVQLSGDPDSVKDLTKVLAAMDQQPPIVVALMMLVEVPAGFSEQVGLTDPNKPENACALTSRETRMLTAAIRDARDRDVLDRLQVTVSDNQTGLVEIGSPLKRLTARVTPRVQEQGVLMNMELNLNEPGGSSDNRVNAVIPANGSLAIRLPKHPGDNREMIMILTPWKIVK